MTKRPQLSIVVPVYNESDNLYLLYKAIDGTLRTVPYRFELIFVDDGSDDNSLTVLEALAQNDKRVRIIEFARNFGKEAAISAGLHHAKGDAVIMLDADMQHPPEIIPQFILKWEAGADVVVGVRKYSSKEGIFKRLSSWLFYRLLTPAGVKDVVPHASDYRLIGRRVINAFNGLTERNRMTRALLDWLGFRRAYVHFVSPLRVSGKAGYGLRKLFRLAMDCFTSNSLLPLKLAGYLGLIILCGSGALGVFMYVEMFMLGDPYSLSFSGTAMLATLIVFLVGLMLACLGLVAMYIARIHAEVANRPLYVVRRDMWQEAEEEL